MCIIIASRKTSRELAEEHPGRFNIISILEPEILEAPKEVREFSKSYIPLFFHDIEYKRHGYVEPKMEHVEKAIAFAEGKDDLIVACHAGISRSSAIAYLVQCTREEFPRQALRVLKPVKHYPNALIVKLGAELLKNDSILDEYYNWLGERVF